MVRASGQFLSKDFEEMVEIKVYTKPVQDFRAPVIDFALKDVKVTVCIYLMSQYHSKLSG